jgi:hypothetical protein
MHSKNVYFQIENRSWYKSLGLILPTIIATGYNVIWEVMDHPAYSPNLATCNFHLFGPPKNHLSGNRFTTDADVKQTVAS